MHVKFTSDSLQRRRGFTLDIRSTLCSGLDNSEVDSSETPEDCNDPAQEIRIAKGEVLQGALSVKTEGYGYNAYYLNDACQKWNIITDKNQVYILFRGRKA